MYCTVVRALVLETKVVVGQYQSEVIQRRCGGLHQSQNLSNGHNETVPCGAYVGATVAFLQVTVGKSVDRRDFILIVSFF